MGVIGAAAFAIVGGGVASVLVLAPSVGVGAGIAIATVGVALVGIALPKSLARAFASQSGQVSGRFERAFDDAAIGMMILTLQLRVIRVNAAMSPLLGRSANELVGRSILEFTHPDDVQPSVEKRESMRDHPRVADAPLVKRYLRPDGSVVDAQVTTALVESENSPSYFFSQLQDVTAQRRAERQKAVIADLGRRALESTDPVSLMGEAMQMVREILCTANCITARRLASGAVRIVAADGETFDVKIAPGQPSLTAYTLDVGEPVLCNDLLRETRFSVPAVVSRARSAPHSKRACARALWRRGT